MTPHSDIHQHLACLREILGEEAVNIIRDPGLASITGEDRPLVRYSNVELLNACRGCMIGMAMAWDDIRRLIGRMQVVQAELALRHGMPAAKPIRDIPEKRRRGTPIRCVETGEVFPSVKAAALAKGANYSAIDQAIRRGCAAFGFHYERVEEAASAPA